MADVVLQATGLNPAAGPGAALHFFVYDLLKITVLVASVAFLMGLVRGALPLEKIRRGLDRPGGRLLGYPAAAAFGALTPFCSCSSVPVFLGFVQARFPIGVAFAFLITSPLVNEIAVALLAAVFGWKFALAYTAAGVALGITGGLTLTLLHAERWLVPGAVAPAGEETEPPLHGWLARLRDAAATSGRILRKIAPWLLGSLALGASLHGFVPEDSFKNYLRAAVCGPSRRPRWPGCRSMSAPTRRCLCSRPSSPRASPWAPRWPSCFPPWASPCPS